MSEVKPCHCGDPYEQHVLTESGTYCVLCARRALERIHPLESAVRKVCEEMRAEKFNEPGTPMWIRAQVVDWAAALERAMEGK